MFRTCALILFTCIFFQPGLVFATNNAKNTNVVAGGAIVSGHPLATQAGLRILENGGNAFDAAVAVSAVLNVVLPAMCGIGGYGSTLIYSSKDKEVRFLNSSGRFPTKTNSDLMRAPTPGYIANRTGPKSISTPGNLNAWKKMHDDYGSLPWEFLFDDAIRYAEEGFPLSPYMAEVISILFDKLPPKAQSIYGRNARPFKKGDKLIQKDLGNTYRLIAREGVQAFYQGEIAQLIDNQMKKLGSFLSIEDLRADVAEFWTPIKIRYKGKYDIYTMGTPGNGFTSLFAIGVMGQFPLQTMRHNSSEYLHVLAETFKQSSKVRLENSGFPEARDNIVNNILTPNNFSTSARSIDTEQASRFELPSSNEGLNTTHFVIIDKQGNVVSSTQTLGTGFGSKVMIDGTGIWMNNAMAFGTFEPKGNPMDVVAGQYKLSSNSPMIILEDGRVWAALGTPGGHTIPQNMAQVVTNLIDFGMSMQEAIDQPKIAFSAEENIICAEKSIPPTIINELRRKGHDMRTDGVEAYVGLNGKIGNVMGIKVLESEQDSPLSFDIGVDERKDGRSTTHLTSD